VGVWVAGVMWWVVGRWAYGFIFRGNGETGPVQVKEGKLSSVNGNGSLKGGDGGA
jgi:hypothetical protein